MIFFNFKDFLLKHSMLEHNDTVIAALSGGPDSTALLLLLSELDIPIKIIGAHMNHCLRGKESDEDEFFVRNLCSELGVYCTVRRIDTMKYFKTRPKAPHDSLQSFARNIRYDFLYEISRSYSESKIALGHNRDDQAETILFRILRGGSTESISGIKPVREQLIRPLLGISKGEILEFLKSKGRAFRLDSSNSSKKYSRNKIRLELLPTLEKYNPKIKSRLISLGEICEKENAYMEHEASKAFERALLVKSKCEITLNLNIFDKDNSAIFARVIKKALYAVSHNPSNIKKSHIDILLDLSVKDNGFKTINLPGEITAEKEGKKLSLLRKKHGKTQSSLREKPQKEKSKSWNVSLQGKTAIDNEINIETLLIAGGEISEKKKLKEWYVLDFEKISPPLKVRFRKKGDRFHPLGMPREMKLKDFFINQKIPKKIRDEILILEDKKKIICVLGVRIDNGCRVTNLTKKAIAVKATSC